MIEAHKQASIEFAALSPLHLRSHFASVCFLYLRCCFIQWPKPTPQFVKLFACFDPAWVYRSIPFTNDTEVIAGDDNMMTLLMERQHFLDDSTTKLYDYRPLEEDEPPCDEYHFT